MSENRRIARSAGIVGISTFLSRILGFVRDAVVAKYFGAGLSADAFFVAFRIPNLLRRLFAEGALTVSFIPVFTEYLTERSKRDSLELVNIAFTILSMILVVISIIGIVFSPLIIRLTAWGFVDSPEKLELTVLLTRIMFPYIFFIGLTALCMGVLNSMGHFAAPFCFVLFSIFRSTGTQSRHWSYHWGSSPVDLPGTVFKTKGYQAQVEFSFLSPCH
jgi:putative peptidoglycan lipid II flippase